MSKMWFLVTVQVTETFTTTYSLVSEHSYGKLKFKLSPAWLRTKILVWTRSYVEHLPVPGSHKLSGILKYLHKMKQFQDATTQCRWWDLAHIEKQCRKPGSPSCTRTYTSTLFWVSIVVFLSLKTRKRLDFIQMGNQQCSTISKSSAAHGTISCWALLGVYMVLLGGKSEHTSWSCLWYFSRVK